MTSIVKRCFSSAIDRTFPFLRQVQFPCPHITSMMKQTSSSSVSCWPVFFPTTSRDKLHTWLFVHTLPYHDDLNQQSQSLWPSFLRYCSHRFQRIFFLSQPPISCGNSIYGIQNNIVILQQYESRKELHFSRQCIVHACPGTDYFYSSPQSPLFHTLHDLTQAPLTYRHIIMSSHTTPPPLVFDLTTRSKLPFYIWLSAPSPYDEDNHDRPTSSVFYQSIQDKPSFVWSCPRQPLPSMTFHFSNYSFTESLHE